MKKISILALFILAALLLSGCCLKHEMAPATCTEPATCTKCGKTSGEPLGHTEVVDEAVEATCTETGLTEGKHCSVCGEVLVEQETVEALGHTEVVDEAVEPTCTETGLTEGKHCSVCGEVLAEQETVEALGHTEVVDEAVEPTCTETGLTEGTHCSVCGEVLVAQKTVDALGHIEVVDEAVKPTCTETGLTEGKHCAVCHEVLVAQETVDALGHTEVIDEAVEPTCTEKGLSEGKHCSVCGEVLVAQKEIDELGHRWAEASCVKPKTCLTCGETEGAPLGHQLSHATWLEPPTCAVCGATEGEPLIDFSEYSTKDYVNLCAAINDELLSRNQFDSFDVPIGTWTVGKQLQSGLYELTIQSEHDFSFFDLSLSAITGVPLRVSVETLSGPFSHLVLEDGDVIDLKSSGLRFCAGIPFPSFEGSDPGKTPFKVSDYTDEELKDLYQIIVKKLESCDLPDQVLPGGIWVVGKDIPAGTYDMKSSLKSNGNYTIMVNSSTNFRSSFADLLSIFGYGDDGKEALNVELQEGYIVVVEGCKAILSQSDDNVFFGPAS